MASHRDVRSLTRSTSVVLAALAVAACTDTQQSGLLPELHTVALGELRDALYPSLTDTLLVAPSDLDIAAGRIYMTETNASRLTVLDLELELVRHIGQRGEGPGELRSPWVTRVRGGRVSVADGGNGRFEFFDTAGTPMGSLPKGSGNEHVLVGAEGVLAVDRDPGALATLIEPDAVTPVGVVPGGNSADGARPFFDQLHRGTLHGDSVLLHIPEATGALRILTFDGILIETRAIPDHISSEISDYHEGMAGAFGGALRGYSFVKGVGVSPDERFVIIASMSDTAPILIHDLDERRVFLVDVSEHIQAGKVQSARTAVYHDGVLYVLSGASVFAFELVLPD